MWPLERRHRQKQTGSWWEPPVGLLSVGWPRTEASAVGLCKPVRFGYGHGWNLRPRRVNFGHFIFISIFASNVSGHIFGTQLWPVAVWEKKKQGSLNAPKTWDKVLGLLEMTRAHIWVTVKMVEDHFIAGVFLSEMCTKHCKAIGPPKSDNLGPYTTFH